MGSGQMSWTKTRRGRCADADTDERKHVASCLTLWRSRAFGRPCEGQANGAGSSQTGAEAEQGQRTARTTTDASGWVRLDCGEDKTG